MGRVIDIRCDISDEEITEIIIGETDRLKKTNTGLYLNEGDSVSFEIESPKYLLKALEKAKELGWFE